MLFTQSRNSRQNILIVGKNLYDGPVKYILNMPLISHTFSETIVNE